jgi:hypothetical protein
MNEEADWRREAERRLQEQADESRRATRAAVDEWIAGRLRDKLLLHLRGGAWLPVYDLLQPMATAIPEDLARRRLALADGGDGRPAALIGRGPVLAKIIYGQATQGRRLVLDDALALLAQERLVELRTRDDGAPEVRSSPREDARFELDPEFEFLLPRAADEVARLEARLLAEGCREPLVVWKGRRLLVDGHTRYHFLALLGRRYDVVEMEFPDRAAVMAWMWEVHYGRRSYTPDAKSYVRGRQYLAAQRPRGGDRRSGRSKSKTSTLKAAAESLAAQYRVDRATIYHDARFAAALDRLAEVCGPELRQRVLARELNWTGATIGRLAKLPPEEQKRLVNEAVETGKRLRLAGSGRKPACVRLPAGPPAVQAHALLGHLGWGKAAQLVRELSALLATAAAGEPARPGKTT